MDSVNNCAAQSNNNVNFQSLKKINLKGYKNCPDKARKILDEFVKNPNVQEFVAKNDVVLNLKADKYRNGAIFHNFEVRYVDSSESAKPKKGFFASIKNLFSKKNNEQLSIKHEFHENNSKTFEKDVESYFDKNSKSKYEWIETKPGVGKDDLGAEGYWNQIGTYNVNDSLNGLKERIKDKKVRFERQKMQEAKQLEAKLEAQKKEAERVANLPQDRKNLENLKNNILKRFS